jgi:tRNA-Thr(GGU) m(6)t(6)A37 methyltransferase TsaA
MSNLLVAYCRSSIRNATISLPIDDGSTWRSSTYDGYVNVKEKEDPAVESRRLSLRPIGIIRSVLEEKSRAPKQGSEGAPDAWLEVRPWATEGLQGVAIGDKIFIITWLHRGRRDVLRVHPRGDRRRPLAGVFATRSPDRPNPLGLHAVTVRKIAGNRLRIGPIEAIDGTPVVDIKPVLARSER